MITTLTSYFAQAASSASDLSLSLLSRSRHSPVGIGWPPPQVGHTRWPLALLWLLWLGWSTIAIAQTSTTVAGDAEGRPGPGNKQLGHPAGVFVVGDGVVYVADSANHRVMMWLPGASEGILVAGGNKRGKEPNQLDSPQGVFVDTFGAVYVADYGNHRIMKWEPGAIGGTIVAGDAEGRSGSGNNQFDGPVGVFVDAARNLYVVDQNNHRIMKFPPGSIGGTTVAGVTSKSGPNNDQLNNPNGVFVDGKGNIYVADTFNDRVMKWLPGAREGIRVAGDTVRGKAANQLYSPGGVFVDEAGAVYVADYENHRIQKWAPGSTTGTTVAGDANGIKQGPEANQLNHPVGVSVDRDGFIYVADQGNNRIQKWPSLIVIPTTVAGGHGQGYEANQLNLPFSVAVDWNGSVYVADTENSRIQKWDRGATTGTTVAGYIGEGSRSNQLNLPTGVFVDRAGAVYVADSKNHRIQKWDRGASFGTTVAGVTGKPSKEANELNSPSGVFVDEAGSVYVADTKNHRIMKWPAGASSGTTVAGFSGQGNALYQLDSPSGVFVDKTGFIYVADHGNRRIQKFPPGATPVTSATTVAGGNVHGNGPNELDSPTSVFVDEAGAVFVADSSKGGIKKFTPGATTGTFVAGGGNGTYDTPTGVFVDKAGFIYMADYGHARITKWVPGATTGTTVAGGNVYGNRADQLDSPTGVFVDEAGAVFVADSKNHRIQKWAPGATTGTTVAGGYGTGDRVNHLNRPFGISVDPVQGTVYVADTYNHRIQKWDRGANFGTTIAGGHGQGPGLNQLDRPFGVFLNQQGEQAVYVADTYNHRIMKFSDNRKPEVVAGVGDGTYGSGPNQLYYPTGVFVDVAGNIYVADSNNDRIQKYSLFDGRITTVAGGRKGKGPNELDSPQGVYVDESGAIYVADSNNDRIQKWVPGSTIVTTVVGGNKKGSEPNQLNSPTGVFVDGTGTIYVADYGNNRIQKFTQRRLGSQLGGAQRALQLLAPLYDCQSGAFTFQTRGGDGSPIEYMAVGITDWTTNPNQRLEPNAIKSLDGAPFLLQVRQNNQTASYAFNPSSYCGGCNFSSGPRKVGSWNGLIVQIRTIAGHNVLVTVTPDLATDKYYPRGDNFWDSFSPDPGAAALKSCLNAGTTGYDGLTLPSGMLPPPDYQQGTEADGAVFFVQNASPNPCEVSRRHVGTWNGLNVEIRTFANDRHALVTVIPGAANDKYFVRGDNFWTSFTKDSGAEQYRSCLNAGTTDYDGLTLPSGIAPPPGYQQGTSADRAVYFSANGLRTAAAEPALEESVLVHVRPNPAQDVIRVTFLLKEAGAVHMQLLDVQGRVHQAATVQGVVGKNERTLEVGSLSTGLYILEIALDGRRVNFKLLKE